MQLDGLLLRGAAFLPTLETGTAIQHLQKSNQSPALHMEGTEAAPLPQPHGLPHYQEQRKKEASE